MYVLFSLSISINSVNESSIATHANMTLLNVETPILSVRGFGSIKELRQKTETEKCTAVILGFAHTKCWYSATKRPGDIKYYHVVMAIWSQENIKCPCDCLVGTGEVNPSSGHRPLMWRKMLCEYMCHSTTGAVLDSSFMDHYIIPNRYLSSSLETVFAVTCWFGTVSWEVITRCSDAATNTSL